jgi:hypothetical protein
MVLSIWEVIYCNLGYKKRPHPPDEVLYFMRYSYKALTLAARLDFLRAAVFL